MTTEQRQLPGIDQLFEQWKSQHCELDRFAQELEELWHRLSNHFVQEQELGKQIALARAIPHPEADAMMRQSERDHTNIANRLKHLSDRMQDAESDIDAWKSCTQELQLILDVLEQHEEQEAESIGWLLPGDSCNTIHQPTKSH